MGRKLSFKDKNRIARAVPQPVLLLFVDGPGLLVACRAVMLTLLAGMFVGTAQAEMPSGNVKRDGRIDFNIPSQPLADALYAYTAVTGVEALASGPLLVNRRSSGVHGMLTADEALHALLSGTGLTAGFVDTGSFTLTQTPPVASEALSDIPRYAFYSAMMQNAVKQALCRQPDTHPGYYTTAVQIWIDPSGGVMRAALVRSTGDAVRDKMLFDVFRTLSIGAPPPAGLPQPATLLILPRTQTSDCAFAGGARAP